MEWIPWRRELRPFITKEILLLFCFEATVVILFGTCLVSNHMVGPLYFINRPCYYVNSMAVPSTVSNLSIRDQVSIDFGASIKFLMYPDYNIFCKH